MKKCVAEFIGTFALVFAGTGAIVIDEVTRGAITHVGISLTFGLVALAMIYAVGFKSLDLFGRSYRRSFGCCCRLSMRA